MSRLKVDDDEFELMLEGDEVEDLDEVEKVDLKYFDRKENEYSTSLKRNLVKVFPSDIIDDMFKKARALAKKNPDLEEKDLLQEALLLAGIQIKKQRVLFKKGSLYAMLKYFTSYDVKVKKHYRKNQFNPKLSLNAVFNEEIEFIDMLEDSKVSSPEDLLLKKERQELLCKVINSNNFTSSEQSLLTNILKDKSNQDLMQQLVEPTNQDLMQQLVEPTNEADLIAKKKRESAFRVKKKRLISKLKDLLLKEGLDSTFFIA